QAAYGISGDQTKDPQLNAQWKKGDYPYPARPRDMWELGVNRGHSFISGDVETSMLSAFGAGLHLRKAINYVFSVRLGVSYLTGRGLDARPQDMSAIRREKTFQQNNIGSQLAGVTQLHRNYKTNIWG